MFKKKYLAVIFSLVLFLILIEPYSSSSSTTPVMYVDPSIIMDEAMQPSGVTEINSYPSNHATNGSVTNPTFAYDLDQLTGAAYDITASPFPGITYFEVSTFNTTQLSTGYNALKINIKMNYSVTLSNAQYQVLLYVGDAYNTLQSWTSTQRTTPSVRTWSNRLEPNDLVWNWTDISNIRIRIETFKLSDAGTGAFNLYETWVNLPPDRMVIGISVDDVRDLYMYQFSLNWSGPIFKLWHVVEGPLLQQGGTTSFMVKMYDSKNYTIVSGTLTAAFEGVDGNGTLAYIEFQIESYGSSDLHLYNTGMYNSFEQEISHTTVDGYFSNTIPGDIDGDGDVDPDDVYVLAMAYGAVFPDPRYVEEADFDGDGDVDPDDVYVLAQNYGKSV